MMNLEKICFIQKGNDGKELDDDLNSISLQQFHKEIWNARFDQFVNEEKIETKLTLKVGALNGDYLYDKVKESESDNLNVSPKDYKFRFASDTLFTGFDTYSNPNCPVIKTMVPEKFHILAHIFGGKIIFPKRQNSINVRRGFRIYDRIDFTLKYIQEFYDNKNGTTWPWGINSLFQTNDKNTDDENFFKLFDTFEKFIEFFFLNDFVKKIEYTETNLPYTEVKIIDLMKTENIEDEKKLVFINNSNLSSLPKNFADYGRWCDNSIYLLEERIKKIDQFIKDSGLQQKLLPLMDKNSNYLYLK